MYSNKLCKVKQNSSSKSGLVIFFGTLGINTEKRDIGCPNTRWNVNCVTLPLPVRCDTDPKEAILSIFSIPSCLITEQSLIPIPLPKQRFGNF